MPERSDQRNKWLVAAWPGIGNVAIGAAAYLVEQLEVKLVHELPAGEFFDANHVDVRQGVARSPQLPRFMFFESRVEGANHDLLIFLGEAQPASGGPTLCRRIIDYAERQGVSRVLTFAAMASQLHPAARPRVFGAVTDKSMLSELREFEVQILEDGQIGGLNGLLLAAAAERDLPGACLLGELPFFAAGVQNPKASMAVLRVFTGLAGIEIDLAQIREASKQLEGALLELLDQMKEAARQQRTAQEQGEPDEAEFPTAYDEDEPDEEDPVAKLDASDRRRIEQLFGQAKDDREVAFHLKEELDRLDVFEDYEDRFLDLFRRAE